MTAFTIPAGVTGRPHFVAAGSIVKVSPAAGATANVEYTTESAVGIANGRAKWTSWPKGAVSSEASNLANNAINVRVTAIGGSVVLDIDNAPGAAHLAAFRSDWGGGAQLQVDLASGSASIAGGDTPLISLKRAPQTPGAIMCDWQPTSGTWSWTTAQNGADALPAPDATQLVDGFPGVKCVFSGTAGTYSAKFLLNNPTSWRDFKTAQLPFMLAANDISTGLSAIQVYVVFSNGTAAKFQMVTNDVVPGKWHPMSFSRYATSTTLGGIVFSSATMASFDSLTVTELRINVATTVASTSAFPIWFGPIRTDGRSTARVSIVLDGCYGSQDTVILPMLDAQGMKASLALTTSDIGTNGRMDNAAVIKWLGRGMEPIHHTFDTAGNTKTNGYVNATDWSSGAIVTGDYRQQWTWIRAAKGPLSGIGKAAVGFASLFTSQAGSTTARQKLLAEAIRAGGVECLRNSKAMDRQQVNIGNRAVPPFMLRGAIQIDSLAVGSGGLGHTAADVISVIDQAIDNGEWAIITIHRAVGDGVTPASLEMTKSNFQAWIDYLGTRMKAGEVIVAPFGETYDACFK